MVVNIAVHVVFYQWVESLIFISMRSFNPWIIRLIETLSVSASSMCSVDIVGSATLLRIDQQKCERFLAFNGILFELLFRFFGRIHGYGDFIASSVIL